MASHRTATAAPRPGATSTPKSFFEQQRALLLGEIAMSFEQVLSNINKLNRSLEAVVTVGNEFSSVEALWSQFEGVMGQPADEAETAQEEDGEEAEEEGGRDTGREPEAKERIEQEYGTNENADDDSRPRARSRGPHGYSKEDGRR